MSKFWLWSAGALYGLAVLGLLAQRYGWFAFKWAFGLLVLALLGLVIVAACALLGSFFSEARRRYWVAGALALAPPLVLIGAIAPRLKAPLVHDVSTNLGAVDFVQAAALRGADTNEFDPAPVHSYPDLAPLSLPRTPVAEAYRLALEQCRLENWQITYEQPPHHLEVIARTPLLRFEDDVAIQIDARAAGGSLVQMRSASRYGHGDLGANATRIEQFLGALERAAAGPP